jgi:cobalamin biosynthesis protein CobD/CbiB
MANQLRASHQDVTHIAGQILNARRSEHKAQLRRELAQARRLLPRMHPRDTFEQERLEVLEEAVECLESPVVERARAAMYLLEQLAGVNAELVSRRRLRA